MKVDIELDISKILESYELTESGILLVVRQGKSPEISTISRILDVAEDIGNDDDEFPEGRELTRLHKLKERNPKVVQRKKNKVLRTTGGLVCEVCGFDFAKFYGQIGLGFAECHHIVSVSKLTARQNTKLSDLAIVCANCHRMLHRAKPLISVIELQAIIKKARAK